MRNRNIYYLIVSLLLVLSLASCRKEPMEYNNPNNRVCKNFSQQFEAVWQGMNQGYMFWDRDTVDWDARYEQYRPIFAEFDARPANHPVSYEEYQRAYTGLFEGLLDHHLTGHFFNGKGRFDAYVSPGVNDYAHYTDRAKQLSILKDMAVPNTYLGCEPANYGSDLDIPGSYFCLLRGNNDGERIAYFRFTSFNFQTLYAYRNALPNRVSAQAPIKALYGPRYNEGITAEAGYANNDSVVGIIIDVRGNGGGNLGDITPLIGALSQQPTLLGYTRVKEGLGRLDYSAWTKFYINTPSLHLLKEKPIVVLADINSASCAELTALLIKNLPNGTFIGERTYGATCALWPNTDAQHDIFYNGCFGDYEYWQNGAYKYDGTFFYYVYTSTFDMVDVNYQSIEGAGVQPDIEVGYSASRLEKGHDDQLERAIRYIKLGH